jgi:cell division protein FtsI/penicillin-binding protein 2
VKISRFKRLNLVGLVLSLIAGLVEVQLVRFQTSPAYQKVSRWADEQFTYEDRDEAPQRGNIYDRYGHLLAGNEENYKVGALLEFVRNPETIANTLKDLPDVKYDEVLRAASMKYEKGKAEFVVLANFVPPNIIDIIREMKKEYENQNPNGDDKSKPSLRGLVWYPQSKRSYPENELASNVVGLYYFKMLDEATGKYGVEEYYNEILSGIPQTMRMPKDPYKINEVPQIPAGGSVILTIDREIQAMVEIKLQEAIKKNEAESGVILVMNPRNGEILAMASQPRINPNMYWQYKKELEEGSKIPYNRAVSQSYEPGSVFKPITMAAALDVGAVTPETIFNDPGAFRYGGVTIYNWDRQAYGQQTMTGCLQHSLNVCLSWVSTQIGAENFYRYLQAFGIGRRTNIDLGYELTYPLYTPVDEGRWYPADLVTNSFGQSLSVTPIQIATAISAIANDGRMMKPHVVKAIIDNGQQTEIAPQVESIPIKAETAHVLSEMLATSLEKEASSSLVPGYRVAGKTGTAQIPTESGYSPNQTNASFVGWGPVDNPRFLVYIWLEKPKSSPWGSVVAAPLFSKIVKEMVVLLDLPPDAVRKSLAEKVQ